MRVVAGIYKGHNLKTLKGDATRPTTMRVKESLFSSLTSLLGTFEGLNVLDGFAGSGGLGIEALSRGAAHVTFFERSRAAAGVVKDNLTKIGVAPGCFTLQQGDALRLAARKQSRPFDLVFLDPPYALEPVQIFDLIETLAVQDSLSVHALICYELAKKNKPACYDRAHRLKWEIVASKDFGDTTYCIARKAI